jgi:hypothetical protein
VIADELEIPEREYDAEVLMPCEMLSQVVFFFFSCSPLLSFSRYVPFLLSSSSKICKELKVFVGDVEVSVTSDTLTLSGTNLL